MSAFMALYYHRYLQGNDTVTRLSNTDLFKFITHTFDNRGKQTIKPDPEDDVLGYLVT
jgi:hypothetical protein